MHAFKVDLAIDYYSSPKLTPDQISKASVELTFCANIKLCGKEVKIVKEKDQVIGEGTLLFFDFDTFFLTKDGVKRRFDCSFKYLESRKYQIIETTKEVPWK